MGLLQISLLGRFQVVYNHQVVSGLEFAKVQELFSYLLLNRASIHPREALAGLLWGESSTPQARRYLRQALWQLHSALDAQTGQPVHQVLIADSQTIVVNPKTDLWLDVAAFEDSYARTKGVQVQDLDTQGVEILKEGVGLYRGDLLEGWYQDWCLFQRERLQNMYVVMLEKLVGYSEIHQQFENGIAYGAEILRFDRAREHIHQAMMRLLYGSGDRTGALRQYQHCVEVLEEELNVDPSHSTQALYQQILNENIEGPIPITANGAPAQSAGPDSGPVLECLRRFQSRLEELQRQLKQEIHTIEQSLNK